MDSGFDAEACEAPGRDSESERDMAQSRSHALAVQSSRFVQ